MRLTDKYERIKRSVIILWILGSGFIFWLTSFLPQSFDEKGFLNYALILFGGGFAFHFLTEIIKTPISEKSWPEWKSLAFQLFLSVVAILIIFGMVFSVRSQMQTLTATGVLLIAVLLVALGGWFVTSRAERVHELVARIQEKETANK